MISWPETNHANALYTIRAVIFLIPHKLQFRGLLSLFGWYDSSLFFKSEPAWHSALPLYKWLVVWRQRRKAAKRVDNLIIYAGDECRSRSRLFQMLHFTRFGYFVEILPHGTGSDPLMKALSKCLILVKSPSKNSTSLTPDNKQGHIFFARVCLASGFKRFPLTSLTGG